MHDIHRHEICRFVHGGLLYRTYFFKDGEIAFTVTGDALRLGLITREDLRWDWDWMRELPDTEETSRIVNVNAQPLRVLRAIALRLAQYLSRHRPDFFYYQAGGDGRQLDIYDKLARRHSAVAGLYEKTRDPEGRYAMFTLRAR